MATLAPAGVNGLTQVVNTAAVATNAYTTRAQAQQQMLVIAELKTRKLLNSIVINNQPSLPKILRTLLQNDIPRHELEASESSHGSSSPFAGPSQHGHTTSLMQELSAGNFSPDEESESRQVDMQDDEEQCGM